MPVINDATVVNSAYDTSGNGGRKIVRLSNGTLVSAVKDSNSTNTYRILKSSDNGLTWGLSVVLANNTTNNLDISLISNGLNVYAIYNFTVSGGTSLNMRFVKIDITNNNILNVIDIDTNQTALGNVSLAINEAGTELHAAWSSKNSTYPNSFNLRYAKGTINTDGSVTWGAVEQRTTFNVSGQDFKNPTMIVKDGKPIIIFDNNRGTLENYIQAIIFDGSTWQTRNVFISNGYIQSSPSAIFVPQSINGLANGRIEVVWGSTSNTSGNSNYVHLFHSTSIDGGATWSAPIDINSGESTKGYFNHSLTVNRLGKLFVVSNHAVDSGFDLLMHSKDSGGTWGNRTVVKQTPTGGLNNPSTLLDTSLNFSFPLFIYQDSTNSKVGFYGTWTITNISVNPGAIGIKSDRNNVLTYAITTDSTMQQVTEKVNGVTVATKTLANGQSTTVSLTQAQWDAVKFGKYANATGGLNTLTVEMGTEKWTYTFNKNLTTTPDLKSAMIASEDLAKTFIPSLKANIGGAIRAKGGTVNDTDSLDTMVGAIGQLGVAGGKKFARGGSTTYSDYATVSGLGFTPSTIIIMQSNGVIETVYSINSIGTNKSYYRYKGNYGVAVFDANEYVNNGGFKLAVVPSTFISYKWEAFE